ncbi:MAG: sigma-70 family RNA polymerase sigma factor [Myxococcales bacterium]|nr:sigma-70 family RNA polymerase sigma factor [Myxococcales bacterium]
MDIDEERLERWRQGDDAAGHALVERHYDAVERFFVNKARDRATDLIQRTFLMLLESRSRIREGANFRAYLFGIARNVLYEYYRQYRRDGARFDPGTRSIADMGQSPTSLIAREQETQLLLHALRRIPIEYQLILELYYWESMRGREIATVLGVPEGTARTRIRRAKQLLEEQLAVLASTPAMLKSTVSNLDGWAQRLRGQIHAGEAKAR